MIGKATKQLSFRVFNGRFIFHGAKRLQTTDLPFHGLRRRFAQLCLACRKLQTHEDRQSIPRQVRGSRCVLYSGRKNHSTPFCMEFIDIQPNGTSQRDIDNL